MKSTRPSVVVVGQCAFTWMFLDRVISSGTRVDVVLAAGTREEDPFVGLEIEPKPGWLVRHRLYVGGWREEVRKLCCCNSVTFIEAADPFINLPAADILVVAGLARRVPAGILKRFGDWALNIHPSLLPHLGGPQPEAQAILQGLESTGVTIHTMTERFDDGPIRYQEVFNIRETDDVWDLESRANACAARGLEDLVARKVLPERVREECGSYFSWYDRQVVLDLRNCSSIEGLKRRLRLRPEGWAYLEVQGRRIFPIRISEDVKRGELDLNLPYGSLGFSRWIEQQPDGGLRLVRGLSLKR